MSPDPRDALIAELEREVAAARRMNAELAAQVEFLTKRVAELEARLGQNSTNTSKPPSSDPPGVTRVSKKPTGRRPGGQPGRKHYKRELVPPEQVDEFIDIGAPEQCSGCGRRLMGTRVEPHRHQVTEVPPVAPVITEYRCHGVRCACCKAVTYGALPAEVQGHAFGERLTAIQALLSGKYRLSKRLVQSALSDLLGVRLSVGSVSNGDMEMSAALATPLAEAESAIRESDSAHMDETGWFEGTIEGRAKRGWLWVVVTTSVSVFRIATSRGSEIAKSLLGEDYAGFLITDRWCGYNWYDAALRQLCWSHLTRDVQGFIDRGGDSARIGTELMEERNRMFHAWHRVRDGTMSREEFQRRMVPVERNVGRLLREAERCPNAKTRGMAKQILKLESAMWTFVEVDGIEPTNNTAERAIRHGVMYRKTSFGTKSPDGSRFVERILTVIATLRQQQRNVLDYLTDAVRAHRRSLPAPSLVPDHDAAHVEPAVA